MKRILIFLLALCLILSATGCGAHESESDELDAEISRINAEINATLSGNDSAAQETDDIAEDSFESFDPPISDSEQSSNSASSNTNFNAPNELELMSYAQTVLEDFYPEPKYSRNQRDYTFINTNLRYKIEGEVSIDSASMYEKFTMIIQFANDKYEEYDLVSLYIGANLVYESKTANDANPDTTPGAPDILNEENTQIYNEVMNVLESQYDRDEDDILEEMAPRYGMTADELKQFMYDYMDAYYQ